MAYKVIILYRLYMPSYFLGTFTEYPLLEVYADTYNYADNEVFIAGIMRSESFL